MKNIFRIFKNDVSRIRSNVIAMIVIMGITVIPTLYAWFNIAASWDPYGNTGNLKIAVASLDEGYDSELINVNLNLGDQILDTLKENDNFNWVFTEADDASSGVKSGKYFAALVIPEDFSRKVERGEQSVVSFYSDMSILLNYKGFLIALTDVTMNLGGKLQTQALGGATQEQINVATQPIPYSSINLYNPESGLASFLLPAILVLILQQSLILGIGMMAGGIYEHRQLHLFYSGREHMHNNVLHLVIGKSLCYFSLYILCTAYILHFIPWLFKYPQIGSQVEIYSFAVPFLLSSIFFGMTLSIFVRERESSFLLFVFTSVIFLFISGITWPRYAMPEYWKWLGALIPSTWGIEGFVRMNTAGAGIYDVRHAYTMLWILTGVYFVTTCLVYRYQIWKDKKRGFSGVLDSGVD